MTQNSIILSFFLVFFYSCGTLDLTEGHEGHPPLCEVHGCPMVPEHIHVYGEVVYVPKYQETAKETFPHHGGHRLNFETENTPWNTDVIDFVCPACDRLYNLYWEKKGN